MTAESKPSEKVYKVILPTTGEEIEMNKAEFMAYHLALKQNLNDGGTRITTKNESKLPSPRINESIPKRSYTNNLNDDYEKSVKTAKKDASNISAVQ
jgi:hypothetical protein